MPNVKDSHKELIFREGSNQTVIPYIPIKFVGKEGVLEKTPIQSILLGPQREDESKSIRSLLSFYKYPRSIKIDPSSISYRS